MILCQYVELLLEISLSLGLVKFVQLALAMCGGASTLVQVFSSISSFYMFFVFQYFPAFTCFYVFQYCKERDTGLPIGSPPIVCLMPFPK